MKGLYPEIEPHESGMLEAGDGNLVYWETCGSPHGKPAVVLHGGPGSGCTSWQRWLFDPSAYRIVLFDQRNCGRSTPNAGEPDIDLASNTTAHLITDIELLRRRLDVERWLVLGGSWGSTLALAYAERYPERVSEMILFGVTTGRRAEFDWLFRGGVATFFPQQWERLRAALPDGERDGDIVDAYHKLLFHSDPEVRERAAFEWCLWESATPAWPPAEGLAQRFTDGELHPEPTDEDVHGAELKILGWFPEPRQTATGESQGPGLVYQHDRNVVADRVGEPAAQAADLSLVFVELQGPLALRASEDLLEFRRERHRDLLGFLIARRAAEQAPSARSARRPRPELPR